MGDRTEAGIGCGREDAKAGSTAKECWIYTPYRPNELPITNALLEEASKSLSSVSASLNGRHSQVYGNEIKAQMRNSQCRFY